MDQKKQRKKQNQTVESGFASFHPEIDSSVPSRPILIEPSLSQSDSSKPTFGNHQDQFDKSQREEEEKVAEIVNHYFQKKKGKDEPASQSKHPNQKDTMAQYDPPPPKTPPRKNLRMFSTAKEEPCQEKPTVVIKMSQSISSYDPDLKYMTPDKKPSPKKAIPTTRDYSIQQQPTYRTKSRPRYQLRPSSPYQAQRYNRYNQRRAPSPFNNHGYRYYQYVNTRRRLYSPSRYDPGRTSYMGQTKFMTMTGRISYFTDMQYTPSRSQMKSPQRGKRYNYHFERT